SGGTERGCGVCERAKGGPNKRPAAHSARCRSIDDMHLVNRRARNLIALRTTCLNTRTGRRLGGGIGSKPSFSAISRSISELFRVFQSMFRTSRSSPISSLLEKQTYCERKERTTDDR